LDTKATKQLTRFADFDVKFPSMGSGKIVFEMGGDLYRFDADTEKTERVSVQILDDHGTGRGGLRNLAKEINGGSISPDGKRVAATARGEVFTVPAERGPTRNLTKSSGSHERDVAWSPDGKSVAYISDASGETELYVAPANGR